MNREKRSTPRRLRWLGLTSIPLALSLRMVAAMAAGTLAVGASAAVVLTSHAQPGSASGNQQSATIHTTSTDETAEPSDTPEASDTLDTSTTGGSPTNHGAAVTSAVASCKAARPSPDASPKPSPGARGIGQCVSAVASDGRAGGGSHPTPH